jgi:hypothetical protein
MHQQSLVRRFAEAGLTLVLSSRPIVGGLGGRDAGSIVQVDIQRKTNGSRRHEWFRIFPGAEENRIEVVGIDKKFGQVVVMIHEPEREFFENVLQRLIRDIDLTQPGWKANVAQKYGVKESDVVGSRGLLSVRRRTTNQKRHMLMGLDERQLFIAQLPRGVSTVREAHVILKSGPVHFAEGQGVESVRQGEWFFLEASKYEIQHIEDGLTRNLLVLETNVPIGPFTDSAVRGRGRNVRQSRGNPHTADELVVLPGIPVATNGFPVRGREVFIRGRVRHIDHATVSFPHWRKVIRNAEPNQGQASGVGWYD